MKEFFNNKRNIIISVVSLVLVVAIVVAAVTFNNNKIDVDNSTTTTQAAGDGTTTEEVTEESSETSDKTQEEDKNLTTDTTTGKNGKETTTKKPNKTETTTKKPVPTNKPSKPDKVPEDEAREGLYKYYGGKEGYEAHLEEVRNYKCDTCGKHDCPSLEYGTDLLGNPDLPSIHSEKCPVIKAETAKCERCGRILSSVDKSRENPEKYCSGNCHINFG